MTPSQPDLEQIPAESDWESAFVEVLDLSLLSSQSIGALLATSRQLRKYVHDNINSLELGNKVDVVLLARHEWPRLAKLALHETGWPMAAAVAQGSWHSLQELEFSSHRFDLLDMQHLAGSTLPQLTRLGLEDCGMHDNMGPGMCKTLINGHWPHLAVLNLYGNYLGAAEVQDLAQGHLPSLASLNLGDNSFGMQALRWDSCNWPHLTKLRVSHCGLGVADIEGLVRCDWPLLAHLDVRNNCLEYTYLRSLAQGHWPVLLELRLENNDNSAAEDLHQANWKSLRMLDFGASCFPLEAVRAVLRVFGESLHTLNVHCEMDLATVAAEQHQSRPCKTSICMDAMASAAILQSLAHGHWPITSLSLKCYNDMHMPPAIAQLFEISLTRMEFLSLSRLRIGSYISDPAVKLQDGNWPALKHLELHCCGLQDDVVVQLTSGQWPLLEILDLLDNFLSVQGVTQLVAGHWPNLSVLDLRHNRLIRNTALGLHNDALDVTLREVFLKSLTVKWPAIELQFTEEDIGL